MSRELKALVALRVAFPDRFGPGKTFVGFYIADSDVPALVPGAEITVVIPEGAPAPSEDKEVTP